MEIRNINTYNSSHEKAFEALCNQLFERWVKKQYTIKHFAVVNGAGGDGGVEAYALFDNNKFAGVQAKWFTESLDAGQINQIRKSITSALTVRPTICHYLVCLPRNFQSDKIGRGKKLVEDTEEKRINTLIDEVTGIYPDLKLEFWNQGRMIEELQKPGSEAVIKFWFTREILSFDFIKNRFELAKEGWLRERYTPSIHTQGEIHSIVQQALYTIECRTKVSDELTSLIYHAEITIKLIDQFNLLAGPGNSMEKELHSIKNALDKYVQLFQQFREQVKEGKELKEKPKIDPIDFWPSIHKLDISKLDPTFNNVRPQLSDALKKLEESEVSEYMQWLFIESRAHNCGILGRPGSGKTHGVANEVEHRLNEGVPSIIIRAKGSPCLNWADILHNSLGGLNDWTDVEIFTAFESMMSRVDVERAGKSTDHDLKNETTNFLIIIDGIDEVDEISAWRERIKELQYWITQFPRLRFVFTSRSYGTTNSNPSQLHFDDEINIRYDLPEEGDVPLLELTEAYLRTYNINYTEFPWILTAFENALSLKLFCEEYKGKRLSELDRPVIVGFTALLNNKINRIETEFLDLQKPGWSRTDQLFRKSLINISDNLILKKSAFHDELASKLVNDYGGLINRNWASKLIDSFCDHGILSKEEIQSNDGITPSTFSYSITFQSYIDYFISIRAINEATNCGKAIPEILKSRNEWNPIKLTAISLFNDLGIMVGENGYWISDLDPENIRILQYEVISNSTSEKIKQYLPELKRRFLNSAEERNEIISYFIIPNLHRKELQLATDLIHNTLVNFKSVFERDLFWSGPDKFSGMEKLTLGNMFRGVQLLPFNEHNELPLILAWSLTATDNVHREHVRKELTRWGFQNPNGFIKIIDLIFFSGDPQLQEDLATIMMGISSLNTKAGNGQKQLATWVLANIFERDRIVNIKNSVVRHCCRAVVERAHSLGECDEKVAEASRPPYCSNPALLSLDIHGKKSGRRERFPIVHDLAWYVIENSYEDLLDDNDEDISQEASDLLRKYEARYKVSISPYEFAMSAAIAFIKGLGWDRPKGPGMTEASHGSVSKLATLEEKYTWLAVHEIQGYLLDLVPYKSYYEEFKRVKDYNILIHVPNPAVTGSFEDDLVHNDLFEDKWYVPENIAPSISATKANLGDKIKEWVNRDYEPDFKKWINISDLEFLHGTAEVKDFITLSSDSSFTESSRIGRTRLQIVCCLIDKSKSSEFLEFFQRNITKLKRMFFNDLERFHASPKTTTYSSVKDVVWMSWMLEDYSIQEIDYGERFTFEIIKTISKVTESTMDGGEKYFQIPSKFIREKLNIVDTDKVKYVDSTDKVQIVFNKAGENWENGQEMLLVNASSFEEFLQKQNLFPFWLVFQINSTTVEAGKLPGYAHSQNCKFWLAWNENNKTKSFLFHNDYFK